MRVHLASLLASLAVFAVAPGPHGLGLGKPAMAQQATQDQLRARDQEIDQMRQRLRDCTGSECPQLRERLRTMEQERDRMQQGAQMPRGMGPGAGGMGGGPGGGGMMGPGGGMGGGPGGGRR